jgi:hypothetical protein
MAFTSGYIWACVAAFGNDGRSQVSVGVYAMTVPFFGIWTYEGYYSTCLFF